MDTIGIVGAGAWGTALAVALERAGRRPLVWAFEPEVAAEIRERRTNAAFLPGIALGPAIEATADLAEMARASLILLVVPAQHLRAICRRLRPSWRVGVPLVICAKGIENGTLATMSEVVAAEIPEAPRAVLSGPTFAREVARGLPTAVTLACTDAALARRLAGVVGSATFRPYITDDVTGAEMGGAVKNVLAIACGVVEGRGLGDNARAALITRGLAELMRLAVAKGARAETCMGLSGLGDLILTASSGQSRNYTLGLDLGQGRTLEQALGDRRSVAEGEASAPAVMGLAARLGVEMPICAAVEGLLHGGLGVGETIAGLLARPFRDELGFTGDP